MVSALPSICAGHGVDSASLTASAVRLRRRQQIRMQSKGKGARLEGVRYDCRSRAKRKRRQIVRVVPSIRAGHGVDLALLTASAVRLRRQQQIQMQSNSKEPAGRRRYNGRGNAHGFRRKGCGHKGRGLLAIRAFAAGFCRVNLPGEIFFA
jgi:hypothetical protein